MWKSLLHLENDEKKTHIKDNVYNEFISVLSCTCMSISIYKYFQTKYFINVLDHLLVKLRIIKGKGKGVSSFFMFENFLIVRRYAKLNLETIIKSIKNVSQNLELQHVSNLLSQNILVLGWIQCIVLMCIVHPDCFQHKVIVIKQLLDLFCSCIKSTSIVISVSNLQ